MVSTNPLLREARGALADIIVFKQMYGKTVMANYPKRVTVPRELQSPAQRGTRDNFRDASAYAKQVLKDTVKKVYYEKKKKQLGLYSAYHAAITDYMRKLKLESVNMKKYTGAIGGQIVTIVRKKDFGAREVRVTLVSEHNGELIESGAAVKDGNGAWVYTNTVRMEDAGNVKVRVEGRGAMKWEVLD